MDRPRWGVLGGTVYPETKSILLKLYPCGANPRVVVIGVQGIPKLNQILLKSYPCGDDPCVVARGYRLSLNWITFYWNYTPMGMTHMCGCKWGVNAIPKIKQPIWTDTMVSHYVQLCNNGCVVLGLLRILTTNLLTVTVSKRSIQQLMSVSLLDKWCTRQLQHIF